jgi:hypothetical protein
LPEDIGLKPLNYWQLYSWLKPGVIKQAMKRNKYKPYGLCEIFFNLIKHTHSVINLKSMRKLNKADERLVKKMELNKK